MLNLSDMPDFNSTAEFAEDNACSGAGASVREKISAWQNAHVAACWMRACKLFQSITFHGGEPYRRLLRLEAEAEDALRDADYEARIEV